MNSRTIWSSAFSLVSVTSSSSEATRSQSHRRHVLLSNWKKYSSGLTVICLPSTVMPAIRFQRLSNSTGSSTLIVVTSMVLMCHAPFGRTAEDRPRRGPGDVLLEIEGAEALDDACNQCFRRLLVGDE